MPFSAHPTGVTSATAGLRNLTQRLWDLGLLQELFALDTFKCTLFTAVEDVLEVCRCVVYKRVQSAWHEKAKGLSAATATAVTEIMEEKKNIETVKKCND